MRESLERERERADADWERTEALQLELERLREQLAEASIPQKLSKNAPRTATVGERRSFGFRYSPAGSRLVPGHKEADCSRFR